MTARRPAVAGSIALVMGTLGGLHTGDTASSAWIVLALAGLVSLLPAAARLRFALRVCACGLLGWALAGAPGARMHAARAHLEAAADLRQRVALRGEVVGSVRSQPASRGEICRRFVLSRLELAVGDGWIPLPRQAVAVRWYGPAHAAPGSSAPALGERWRMQGTLHRSRRALLARASGEAGGGLPLLLISRARASRHLAPPAASWRQWMETRRRTAADRLAAGIEAHPDDLALIQAMMLGYRRAMPRPLSQAFRVSGTIHIFAISGLHVVVIAALLTFAVARLGVPRHLWIVPLAPILALYIVATGAQPSALRAGLMAILYLLAPLLGRRPDALTTLAVSAVLLLLVNPVQILDLGFVLSYMMVLGLIIMAGPTTRLVRRLAGIDRLVERADLMNRLGGELGAPAWRARLRTLGVRLLERFTDLAAVSLAAWLVSAPLSAYYFGFFPAYSLLANLLVVPLSSLVMLLASLSLLLGSLSLPLNILCNQTVWLATALMRSIAVGIASWPCAAVRVTIPLGGVILWHGVVWSLAGHEARRHARRAGDATWLAQARAPQASLV
ncbi:MAG: ComEC/Rec2 family competence protein [Lentisphaerae bacterium]|nr:ComEC/Rec2 family competence protein [Lentisphaerota bacterium]